VTKIRAGNAQTFLKLPKNFFRLCCNIVNAHHFVVLAHGGLAGDKDHVSRFGDMGVVFRGWTHAGWIYSLD
jgi:hypothetical protein